MSLRRSVLPSVRAVHPALFLVGLAVVVMQVGFFFTIAIVERVVPAVYGTLLSLAGPFVVLVMTLPLAVGLYGPVRERTGTVRETLLVSGRTVRRHYVRVFVATLAAFGAAFAIAVAATAVAFVVHTVVKYGWYAVADPGPPTAQVATWTFPLLFVAFLVMGILLTRFADVFAAFDDVRPRSAWRASLSFARREPASFLGYATVTSVLLGTSQVLSYAFGSTSDPVVVLGGVALIAVVGTVGSVFWAALHVTYFDRGVAPTVQAAGSRPVSWTRVTLVALVLCSAVAGAGYVRAVDPGTGQDEMRGLPDDPHAAYSVAANNTANANHRYVLESRNESDPDATFRTIERSGIDYEDRQMYVYIHGEDVVLGGYFGEGTMATLNGGGSYRSQSTLAPLARQSGNWSVLAVPGYGLVAPREDGDFEYDDVDWSIESTNESTVVYRVDEQEQIHGTFTSTSYAGSTAPLADDSYVEVYVDREAGIVSGARYRLHSRETGNDFTYVARYEEVGTADLERPDGLGKRSALELLWDATYY